LKPLIDNPGVADGVAVPTLLAATASVGDSSLAVRDALRDSLRGSRAHSTLVDATDGGRAR
jgi:hypothetical protein